MTISRNKTILGLAFALLTVAAGCEGQPDAESPDDAQVADSQDSLETPQADAPRAHHEGRGPHMGHHKGGHGPDRLLHAALETLDLSAEQRASLEAVQEELRAGFQPPDRGAHQKALAADVRSGSVDVEALAADRPDMTAMHAKMTAAIDKLHATLTVEQRQELVASLQAKAERFEAKHREGREGGPEGRDGMKGPMGKGPIDFMLRGIEISDAQRAKIDAAIVDAGLDTPPDATEMKQHFEAMKEQRKAMLEAFASDSFSAAKSMPAPPAKAGAPHERFAETLAVVVPLLDETQREALAKRIEEGPMRPHGKMGRGMRHGMRRGMDASSAAK
ncbi:MAG: Spy/CpxP family protein refolding chaperone [Myxococcales bacterium]|nr:Spy/CpxP family protein refolding chaperone [Myxococcales bacterium]